MKKYIYTILLVWLAMVNVQAQENNEIQEPKPDEKVVVGAIGGTVDLTALGGASYTIPVKVPEGIGGIQPNLSIVYNSQSGNGLLGWGWNLGGLSAITRVGQTNYHDGKVVGVSLDYHDRFALDGQRLIVLDGASYGSNEAEYKTEVDGLSKIVSYKETGFDGPASFKVWTSDGLVMEYGRADNARIVHNNGSGSKTVVMWLLNRVEDRNGNYMTYHYHNNGESATLYKIYYTIREDVLGCYSVELIYSSRSDVESVFIGDHVMRQKDLLTSIQIKWWEKELWRYDFGYDAASGINPTETRYLDDMYIYNRLINIQFICQDAQYYTTVIDWGNYPNIPNTTPNNYFPNCHDFYITAPESLNCSLDEIVDKVKFVGDFNGDGLSDFVTATKTIEFLSETDTTFDKTTDNLDVWQLDFYLNKGNTKEGCNSGKMQFERKIYWFLQGLKWCFVGDFDGDGLDDFYINCNVPSGHVFTSAERIYACRSIIGQNGEWNLSTVMFKDENGGQYDCFEKEVNKTKAASFMVGDFCGRGQCDAILAPQKLYMQYPKFVYFTYDDGVMKVKEGQVALIGTTFRTGDFDGDGITEIWYASSLEGNHSGVIRKIYQPQQGLYSTFNLKSDYLSSDHNVFIADFNGDGHADFFYYDKEQKKWMAEICGLPDESAPIVLNLTAQLVEYYCDADPGEYGFSIEGRILDEGNKRYYVELTDINGDGKSDLIIRNNSNVVFFYSPLVQGSIRTSFSRVLEYNARDMGLAGTKSYSICSGNFFGQENSALLSDYRIHSAPSITDYYNVQSITDGMGNRISFDYDYLVHNPMKSNNIYDVNQIGQNLGYDLYDIPLPMKAVKALNSYNVNLPTQAHAVDSFSYANAVVHRKGKGLLGFTNIARDSWLVQYPTKDSQWTKHQGKLVQTYNYKPMEEHRALVPETEELYRYRDDGEEVLTASTVRCYNKGLCERDMNSQGIKVFTPLTVGVITDEYELLGERGHLRRRIVENDYNDQQLGGLLYYRDVFRVTESRQGTDPGTPAVVSNCEFQTKTHTEYAPLINTGSLWVPNRPYSVFMKSTRNTTGYTDTKSLTVYFYDNDKPYLPKYVNIYPSGEENESDPLAMTAYYTYYPTGRLKDESHYPVAGRSEDGFKTMYAYSPDYRFLTTKTEEYDLTHTKDYITLYQYDNAYGNLRVETDCNGYSTYTENPDHLGLTVRSYKRDNDANQSRIPGTETVTALRWIEGSAFEGHALGLPAPCYFTWERSSGSAETLVIYDALGRRLRTVSHGLPENGSDRIVYQDTRYDQWGRLAGVSEPYFSELPLNQRKWTTYEYGDFDRIDTVMPPTYMVGNQTIEPYTRYEYDGLTTTTTTGVRGNDDAHVTTTTINVMGWTESNVEVIDGNGTENVTTYGHNADGSLAWAMVNGNESTKVKMHYDDAGNRRELYDPNYGKVTNHYNAFGQLVYTVTPKGDTTAYEYDNIGRVWHRTETCVSNQNEPERLTVWNYSETPGRKGLLEGIVLEEDGNETQSIAYAYDMQRYNRMTSKTETLFGTPYTTGYAYSDQDGFPLRLKTTTYPTGFSADREYDATTGQMVQLSHNGTLLWKTEGENAFGQVTQFRYGNGITSRYEYDDRHLLASQIAEKDNETIQSFGYAYDIFANLAARTDNTRNLEERFTYDRLNRLDSIWLNDLPMGHMAYDALGRMTDKRADGYDVFSLAQHDYVGSDGQLRPHAVSSATMGNSFPQASIQSIGYTMFDKVRAMNCNGSNRYVFEYGYDHQRTRMTATDGGMLMVRKDYVDNCEFVRHTVSPQQSFTYLSGPMGVFAMVNKEGETEEVLYILKDHLGSYTAITDDEGDLVLEQSFDAWGNRRDPSTWSGNAVALNFHDRGFTGHEHLFGMVGGIYREIGLINMNGRMYDPVMSSFLSVDNYVQAPDFSQSFNRYAYCLNNPLRYTDPSGEFVITTGVIIAAAAIIGAGIGTYQGYKTAVSQGLTSWDMAGKMVLGGLIGAASGAASAGVGVAVGGAVATAEIGGFLGGFITGGASGFVGGSISGYGMSRLAGNTIEQSLTTSITSGLIGMGTGALLGGVSSGIASSIKGNNFWNGKALPTPRPAVEPLPELTPKSAQSITSDKLSMTPIEEGNYNVQVTIEGEYSVYYGKNSEEAVKYVGITKRNPEIRWAEHLASNTKRNTLRYELVQEATGLTKNQARILEQQYINLYGLEKNGGQLLNQINSIAPSRWNSFNIRIDVIQVPKLP